MLDIKAEFKKQWPQFVEQVQDNVRLRICLWVIAIILVAYPLLLIADYNNELNVELEQTLEKEAKILRTANEKQWFERSESLEQLQQEVNNKFGVAESLGTAKAATFQELRAWANDTNVSDFQVKLEEPVLVDEANGIFRISGQISLSFDMQPSLNFLHLLESHKQKVVIERMEISQRTRPVFKLVIATYFRVNNN